eukprot:Rmarinus@m.20627
MNTKDLLKTTLGRGSQCMPVSKIPCQILLDQAHMIASNVRTHRRFPLGRNCMIQQTTCLVLDLMMLMGVSVSTVRGKQSACLYQAALSKLRDLETIVTVEMMSPSRHHARTLRWVSVLR